MQICHSNLSTSLSRQTVFAKTNHHILQVLFIEFEPLFFELRKSFGTVDEAVQANTELELEILKKFDYVDLLIEKHRMYTNTKKYYKMALETYKKDIRLRSLSFISRFLGYELLSEAFHNEAESLQYPGPKPYQKSRRSRVK